MKGYIQDQSIVLTEELPAYFANLTLAVEVGLLPDPSAPMHKPNLLHKMMANISFQMRPEGIGDNHTENATTDRAADRCTQNRAKRMHPNRDDRRHDGASHPSLTQFE
jgi:hypothetical protein